MTRADRLFWSWLSRRWSVVGTASEPGGLSFNDWQPLDAETWAVLERVKRRASVPNR
jgi:hypothetical protein